MRAKKHGAEKEQYWQATIREAARSGGSIRAFCRRHRVKESQFYWWQRKLKAVGQQLMMRRQGPGPEAASFALVSDERSIAEAGIELVLGNGRRLRIGKGVDAETLRSVLAAVEPQAC